MGSSGFGFSMEISKIIEGNKNPKIKFPRKLKKKPRKKIREFTNKIAKFSQGISDDLASTVLLASDKKIFISYLTVYICI